MTHEEKVREWLVRETDPRGAGVGVEVGPGDTPVPGVSPRPFYVDCFKEFGRKACLADYYGHASRLPFHDHSLDYVISSHVLEHVANPVAALAEWYRVLRPEGVIYLVVPDRRLTWDRTRPLTTVEHMLDDFSRGTTAADPTHVDEFAFGIDWALFSPTTPTGEVAGARKALAAGMHAAVARGEQINIHFHTFERSNLLGLFAALRTWPDRRFDWDVVDCADYFPQETPNGLLVIVRVHKGWRERAEADWFRIRTEGDPMAAVRPDAERFEEFIKTCSGLGGVR